jgi:hypothetical protein
LACCAAGVVVDGNPERTGFEGPAGKASAVAVVAEGLGSCWPLQATREVLADFGVVAQPDVVAVAVVVVIAARECDD